jgi:O-antigen ligase
MMSALAGRSVRHLILYVCALPLAVVSGAAVAYAQVFVGDNGPYMLVGAFMATVVAAAILLQWRLGGLILLAALPYEAVINAGALASGTKLLALLTFFSLALALVGEPELAERFMRLWQQPLTLAVLAFVLWSLASVLWAYNGGSALAKTITFIGLFGLMVVISMLEARYLVVAWAVIALSAALSVPAGYILPQSGKMLEQGRFGTGGADPNAFAIALVIIFLVAFFGVTRYRPLIYLAAPFLMYGIFATQSRTALVALAAAPLLGMLVPWVAVRMGGRTMLLYGMGVVALALIALIIPTFSEILSERYSTLTQYQDESTWSGRWSIWEGSFQVIASHPVLGVGAGNFGQAALNYSTHIFEASAAAGEATGVAHNMFLSVAAELGAVGLILFLGVLFFAFRALLALSRLSALGAGLLLGFVAYGIGGMSLTSETDKLPYVIYGSILSLLLWRELRYGPKGEETP